jgi:hypothetical protein
MRFGVLRIVLPAAAFTAAAEAARQWWDGWLWLWRAMFDPEERAQWKDDQREQDAHMIDHGMHGGFAAGSGGDEG